MGNMHIVTGYKGENHVTAADVGSFQASVFGTGQYVLNRGSKFSTTVVTNNKIRVADGDLLIQGRHVRLNEGNYVDLTIDNGQQDYLRNDLIVARYTKDSTSGVEDVNLVVIKGTPAASNPVDPSYTSGDIINDHVYLADMPLYRVPLDGLNVGTLVALFTEATISIADGSVTTAKINGSAVTTDKIADGAVTSAKLASGAVTPSSIGAASLDSNSKVNSAQASSSILTKTASYTLTLTDAGKMVLMNVSAANTVTIPANDSVAFPAGTEIEVCQIGTGNTTISVGTGVTIYSIDGAVAISGRYGCVSIKKLNTNAWLLAGALA